MKKLHALVLFTIISLSSSLSLASSSPVTIQYSGTYENRAGAVYMETIIPNDIQLGTFTTHTNSYPTGTLLFNFEVSYRYQWIYSNGISRPLPLTPQGRFGLPVNINIYCTTGQSAGSSGALVTTITGPINNGTKIEITQQQRNSCRSVDLSAPETYSFSTSPNGSSKSSVVTGKPASAIAFVYTPIVTLTKLGDNIVVSKIDFPQQTVQKQGFNDAKTVGMYRISPITCTDSRTFDWASCPVSVSFYGEMIMSRYLSMALSNPSIDSGCTIRIANTNLTDSSEVTLEIPSFYSNYWYPKNPEQGVIVKVMYNLYMTCTSPGKKTGAVVMKLLYK